MSGSDPAVYIPPRPVPARVGIAPPHPVLARLFGALEQRALRWMLLRIPANLSAPTGDVDILVAPADCEALRDAAEQLGFIALPGWRSAPHLILMSYDRASDRWLVLDVMTTVGFRSPPFWRLPDAAGQVLARRQLHAGVALPAEADAFWLLLLHCLLDKGFVSPHHRARLRQFAATAQRSPLAAALVSAAGKAWTSSAFPDAVHRGDWRALEEMGGHLAADLGRRRGAGERLRIIALRSARTARKPLLLPRRRGVNLALLGPDGAGKSTAAAAMRGSLPFESRVIYMGLWKDAGGGRWRRSREVLARPLRIWCRYLLAQYHQCRGRLVIFDRYVYESALPARPPLVALKRPYFWLLGHVIPPAQAAVVLDVPAPVAYARKRENTPAELESERRFYRQLAARVPSLEVVDASQDAEAVRTDITSVVWRSLALRWQGSPAGGETRAADRSTRG
jgi:thymidylate kinase